MGADVASRVYLSHGHAAVVVSLSTTEEAEALVGQAAGELLAHEIWPHSSGRVGVADIVAAEPECDETVAAPEPVDDSSLTFEGAAQVRQFNSNIALLAQVACRYAPEVAPLISWLHTSVTDIAAELEHLAASTGDDTAVRRSITLESVLVEANAILTLFCSQLGSGQLPLRWEDFPVGEYSLLGIGGMIRSAWRIYAHLNATFAHFDHVGLIQRRYRALPAFDAFAPSSRRDYSSWRHAQIGVAHIADGNSEDFRFHIPCFSSRWGFHESLHSISMSWQCLYASATKEWSLLTLTHEFLHAHVRDLLSEIINPADSDLPTQILRRYNSRSSGDNALEAMQVAYVEALVGIHGCIRLAHLATDADTDSGMTSVPAQLDLNSLSSLIRSHSGLVHEIIVHVLDFLYVYDGRDADYINSIWSSWSLVPSVIDHIDHYVLRTICALAVTSPDGTAQEMFDDARARLRHHLNEIVDRPRIRPATERALELLDGQLTRRQLFLQFPAGRYVVELARHFFVDRSLNAELVRDDNTTIRDGRRTYAVDVGDFRGEDIASPVGFLLDRFPEYADQAGSPEAEYASLWQMLQLV
jgi:hypothetical protein